MCIRDRIPESRIPLATAYVQEFEEFYLVCDGKKMFYVLPKSALEPVSYTHL